MSFATAHFRHVSDPSFIPARDDRTDIEKLQDAMQAKLAAARALNVISASAVGDPFFARAQKARDDAQDVLDRLIEDIAGVPAHRLAEALSA